MIWYVCCFVLIPATSGLCPKKEKSKGCDDGYLRGGRAASASYHDRNNCQRCVIGYATVASRARARACIRASAAAAGAHEWPGTHPHEKRQQLSPEITENLYLLNQTAKRQQLSAMPTISRCLLGIMQIDTL
jgi:hypothetical protein